MTRARVALAVALAASLAVTACGKKSESPAPTPAPAAGSAAPETAAAAKPTAGSAAGAAAAKPDAKPEVTAASVKAEALDLLGLWVKAQNGGDQAAYFAMYETAHFTGVKRTAKGVVKKFDFEGWKKDRTRMFGDKPTVQADEPSVETWLDPDSKLKQGVSVIRFTQRWKTAKYADHGIKALHVWRDPEHGQRIIYEDLINAEKGWDDAASADVADLEGPPPADDAAALALWKKLAPTGKDYEDKLAAIPDEAAFTRPMARALLAGGNFDCKETIEYDECGEEYAEWKPLDEAAGFDDACLRRRLAIWALEDGELEEKDVVAVTAELDAMLALDKPEDELQKAVMSAVEEMSEPTRVRFVTAAIKAEEVELAGDSLDGLSDKSLIQIYEAHSLDAAVDKLDMDKHRPFMLEAMTDSDLTVETRTKIFEHFENVEGDDVAKAIGEVADDDESCELAMDAASALATRGDPSHLPKKPAGNDADAAGRALCMIMHDTDGDRALAVWKTFLPAKKGPIVTEELHDDFASEYEADAGSGDEPDEADAAPERIERKETTSVELDDAFGEKAPDCSGNSCEVETSNGNYTVSFEVGDDGTLYISELHTYRWSGCPC